MEFVVPELQKLGRYKTSYREGSLRHKLFGSGDRLPDDHIGARYRIGGSRSTALAGGAAPRVAPNVDQVLDKLRPIFEEIAQTAAERESDRLFDLDVIEKLKGAGFTRLRVPRQYGGYGFNFSDTFRVFVELAAADSNIAQALRPHFLAVESLLSSHDETIKKRWLPRVGSGEIAIGNALTEIDNRPGEVTTTLRPNPLDPGSYILEGTKYYSTGSLYADVIYVRARLEDTSQSDDVFLFVNRNAPGVTLLDDWDGFGQQLSASGTTVFDKVVIDARDIIYRDYTKPAATQALAQAHHLSTLTGIGIAIERDFVDYVRRRKRSFSHGNATLPRDDAQVQQVIGEISAKAYAASHILGGFVREA